MRDYRLKRLERIAAEHGHVERIISDESGPLLDVRIYGGGAIHSMALMRPISRSVIDQMLADQAAPPKPKHLRE